jgi:outer membrane protein assembly factor BamB
MNRRRRLLFAVLLVVAVAALAQELPRVFLPKAGQRQRVVIRPERITNPFGDNWLQFSDGATGITQKATTIEPANAGRLRLLFQAALPDHPDGSPAYASGVETADGTRDLLVLTTINGSLLAVDAYTGDLVWQVPPPPNGVRWTTSSPAIDSARHFVYTYGTDGYVRRPLLSTGELASGPGWPALVTLKPDVEKGSSPLVMIETAAGDRLLYAMVAGYPEPGDAGDYQGHVTVIDLANGHQRTFNAACSDRMLHFDASGLEKSDCRNVQSGLWARAGVVYDEQTDRVFATTANGVFDGVHNWGDSVVALRPDLTTDGGVPLDSYTPAEYDYLNVVDADLGSTALALVQQPAGSTMPRVGVQGGKDWLLRVVDLDNLSGRRKPGMVGGELQVIQVPQTGAVFTRPLTWLDPGNTSWVFVANNHGTAAFRLAAVDGQPRLAEAWVRPELAGTSPILVNGVLYIADDHELRASNPADGTVLWRSQIIGGIHWQTPIVANNVLYIADDDGLLSAFAVPGTVR